MNKIILIILLINISFISNGKELKLKLREKRVKKILKTQKIGHGIFASYYKKKTKGSVFNIRKAHLKDIEIKLWDEFYLLKSWKANESIDLSGIQGFFTIEIKSKRHIRFLEETTVSNLKNYSITLEKKE